MGKKLRILHAPYEIAGQAYTISRAQRKLGYESDVIVFNRSPFGYKPDVNLNLSQYRFFLYDFVRLNAFLKFALKYDVFHFHFGESFLKFNFDLPILRFLGKKVVMQYWGSDVHQTDILPKYTNWTKETIAKIYPGKGDDTKRKKLAKIARWANQTIVGSYALLPYTKESMVISQAIDLESLPFIGAKAKKEITIVHASTDKDIKGTDQILEVVEKLKKAKFPIKFVLVENKKRRKALEIYKKADILIDNVLQGHYGIFAIEGMALGKPVVCFTHPKFKHYYHHLPIVNSSPQTIYKDLVNLIKKPQLRAKLGREGRKYVEKNHDALIIAKKLINLYQKL